MEIKFYLAYLYPVYSQSFRNDNKSKLVYSYVGGY